MCFIYDEEGAAFWINPHTPIQVPKGLGSFERIVIDNLSLNFQSLHFWDVSALKRLFNNALLSWDKAINCFIRFLKLCLYPLGQGIDIFMICSNVSCCKGFKN